jgi:D-xylose transport system ATP-binding protein
MMPTTVLELLAIDKRFGGVHALRSASFSATAGEIHALCGENGAGKSTMLKILSGVHPHGSYDGTVRVHGKEHAFKSTRDAQNAGIAIVHQELMLVPELSVAQNLVLGREETSLGLLDDDAIEHEARALLARFGVKNLDPTMPVGDLGIGMQQVVEIVRALSQDAKVLILDEPTAALTGEETDRLMEWLRELRTSGTTCVYVSHRMDEVFTLCDRVTVLRDGKTVGTVDVAAASADEVVAMMVGRSIAKGKRARVRAETRTPPPIEVTKLTVPMPGGGAGRANAVEDVSLSVRRGEVVAICGAMGSGRTALLSTLFGCARAGYHGVVKLDGKPVRLSSPRDAIAKGLAFIPEDRKGRGLVLGMSVSENLALPPSRSRLARLLEWIGFIDDEEEELLAQRRIDELKIRGAADAEVATLSGGNQQKVVLGKWLEDPPHVLLLDEPTRGVDVGAREEIYGLVERLGERGAAVLLASSDLLEVLRLAHRVIVLRHGKVVAELDGRTTTEAEIVQHATGASPPALAAHHALREMHAVDAERAEREELCAP